MEEIVPKKKKIPTVLPSLALVSNLFCSMLILGFTFSSVKKTTEKSLTNKVRWWRRRNVQSAWLLGMAAFQIPICLFLRGDTVRTTLTNGHLN